MDLIKLLPLAGEMPEYRQLVAELKEGDGKTRAVALEAAKPYLITALYQSLGRPMVVVSAQPEKCQKIHEQIAAWSNSGGLKFPEPDALPYERIAADSSTELERVQVLSALAGMDGEKPPLIVVSAPALMGKLTPHRDFAAACHTLKPGMEVEPFQLLGRWQAMGYCLENTVEMPGTIAHRGGIVDIYPPTSELPARIEFLGNTIDSLRLFDPASQRSSSAIESLAIGPATELLAPLMSTKAELEEIVKGIKLANCSAEARQQFERELDMLADKQELSNLQFYAPLFNTDSLLDFLPQDCLLVLDELPDIEAAIDELDAQAEQLRAEKIERKELPINFPRPYFSWAELEPKLKPKPRLRLTAWGVEQEENAHHLSFSPTPGYAGQLPVFIKKAKQLLGQKKRLIIVSHQASRLSELLEQADIMASPVEEIKQIPPPASLTLVQGLLGEGWVMDNETFLLTDAEIFGFIKHRRLVKRRPVPHHQFLIELAPGDYVVHVEHGIAKFAGVTRMANENSQREYLVLKYAANDRLYVPTDQIDRVNRYVGAGDQPPTLSRLGTQEWARTKQKVKESVAEVAQELLMLYAAREVVPGFAFARDSVWQQELEASFPYVETPDQMEAQAEVKADMEKASPMDRLVCGDVGYGKTEVAIRAAFKAVMDGKQVAVLVPTTVLAQQHFATFKERLEAFPVRIEVLSRFKTPREQQAIVEGLASGGVDICIGTHRLLQKDINFKNLGLLIIDEEQRFGVAHKEHLKKMRQEVDVLTLSATPIPRTLHMSLVGVRDMSTMETPPEQRLPIKTYVARYDERLVREAILRELERNGQVFFVHNRVQSIAFIASKLQDLVPEARIAVAHGQMPEGELERVMTDFAEGESDILVCSTIIESGLDMPNVNTLIVNRADRFGLTQLYQLRGRVGRGANLAHAYFLYDKGKMLTPTAEKRLKTIFEATELGAGFSIALKDLEIRGAGTLLGVRQSGHISAVGFSLYTRLLAEAVEAQRAKQAGIPEKAKPSPLPPPTIDLPLKAFIPEDYVADIDTRLSLYQKLARVDKLEQIEALAREFSDRFGKLPAEVKNLLYALKIKLLAARAGIESVSTEDGEIVLRLFGGMQFDREKLEPFLGEGVTPGKGQISLNYKRVEGWRGVLEGMLKRVVI
ncbi:MAG: transcription-repair coupling factor [Dehalococcoidales bacterium]|nr:transcription-repair coupling factor [Dehalococcoidales bacterium]